MKRSSKIANIALVTALLGITGAFDAAPVGALEFTSTTCTHVRARPAERFLRAVARMLPKIRPREWLVAKADVLRQADVRKYQQARSGKLMARERWFSNEQKALEEQLGEKSKELKTAKKNPDGFSGYHFVLYSMGTIARAEAEVCALKGTLEHVASRLEQTQSELAAIKRDLAADPSRQSTGPVPVTATAD